MNVTSHRLVRTRIGATLAAISLLSTLIVTSAEPATAADSSSAMLTSVSGPAASNVSPGDIVVQKTEGQVSAVGEVNAVLEQTIDTTKTKLRGITSGGSTVPDVTSPDGWTVEYFNGSSWSASTPTYDNVSGTYTSVQGVRASKSFTSMGKSGSQQVAARTITGTVPSAVNFNGSSGGDGWDVFFGGDLIFNIWHHDDGAVSIDCHDRTGAACWNSVLSFSGYSSSAHSTGFYDSANDRIYSFGVRHSDNKLGLVCAKNATKVTRAACDIPFIAYDATGGHTYGYVGDAVRVGDKIYFRGSISGDKLNCFDMATSAKCVTGIVGGTDGIMTDGLVGNSDWSDNRLLAVGTKVFISTGTRLACFDTTANAMCSGFGTNGVATVSPLRSLFYTTDANAVPTQVCAYRSVACWNISTGAVGTWPSGLSAYGGSIWDQWGATTNSGTMLFHFEGDTSRCFDFAINASCAGFTGVGLGSYPYAIVQDPQNSLCMWSNSNNGAIKNFVKATGASPCSPQQTAQMTYPDVVPLLGCVESDRVTSWTSLKVYSPTNAAATSAKVTVYDKNGVEITGWKDKTVTLTTDAAENTRKSGTLDLSGLPVNDNTKRPSFAITFPELISATGAKGTFTMTQGAPALCVGVKVQTTNVSCPTGVGDGSADFPLRGSPISYSSTVTITPSGGSPAAENSSASATRVISYHAADCLTSVNGIVYRGDLSTPLANTTVTLMGPSGTTGLVATTAADGSYTFTGLYPNTYRGEARTVIGASAQADYGLGANTRIGDIVIPTYTMTYDGNGQESGSVPVDPQTYMQSESATVLGNTGALAREGYGFSGWSTARDGTGAAHSAGTSVNFGASGVTLYAQWTANQYNVLYEENGGSDVPDGTYVTGGTFTLAKAPTRKGHTFVGWNTQKDALGTMIGAGDSYSPAGSGDLTFHAVWTKDPAPNPSPVIPGTNPELPAEGVPPGEVVALVDGVKEEVVVSPDRSDPKKDPDGLIVTGNGFSMTLRGLGSQDRPLQLTEDGAIVLEADRKAEVSGTGFLPDSDVNVYVFSDPRYLGTVRTDADGNFRGTVPVPLDLNAGRHTLQSNGITPDRKLRSLSVGVQVQNEAARALPKSKVIGKTIRFPKLSSWLRPQARERLVHMVKRAGDGAVIVSITGYVQANGQPINNHSLSMQRAKAIKRFVKSKGVEAKYRLHAAGVAKQRSPLGRKAVIKIRFVPRAAR